MKAFSFSLALAAAIVHVSVFWLWALGWNPDSSDYGESMFMFIVGGALPIVLAGAAISAWGRKRS
jgi:hypothetical protein